MLHEALQCGLLDVSVLVSLRRTAHFLVSSADLSLAYLYVPDDTSAFADSFSALIAKLQMLDHNTAYEPWRIFISR